MRLPAPSLALALAFAFPALAAPVFVEDFESGEAAAWAPSGDDARLTQYADNTSLRLSGRSAVVRAISTRGFTGISLSAAMAATGLGPDGHCQIEVSADEGQTWMRVLRVEAAQADGVTLHSGVLGRASLDDAERLLIGARSVGGGSARCWLDNVRVAGTPIEAAAPRTALSRQDLTGGAAPLALLTMAAFAPAVDAEAAPHGLEGVLAFSAGPMDGFVVHRDSLDYQAAAGLELNVLPALEIELVSHDGRLVPLRRGPISGAHPSWEFALEPGRLWREPGDGGLSRAALPFALIETNANCTHNGVLTFLYGEGGVVSHLAWQIASETCAYLQFDAWGLLEPRFTPGLANAAEAVAADARDLAGRMPTRPLSALAQDHPGGDPRAFASPAEIDPRALSTFGVVVDGVHYLGDCPTRAGPYPFCEALLVPSYSVAKSLAAGLGLMRLEKLHPGVVDARIADHISQCSAWGDVTFGQTLDMATGRYRSSADQADENAMLSHDFFATESHDAKLEAACTLFPRREAPGRRWVYHTTDTYVLGAAMSAFWRAEHGKDADFFNDVLVDGIYRPLSLDGALPVIRRTRDAAAQPFFGWGLTLTRDHIARLGDGLARPDAHPDLVDRAMLNAALQREPATPGLSAGAEPLRYKNGFWAWNAQVALSCPTPVWIPMMSGFGGVIIAVMPNGVTYYYFSDGGDFAWARAARAADAVSPLCVRNQP